LRTQEEIEKAENRLIKRQTEKKRKLAEAGIKYDFEAVAYVGAAFRTFHISLTSLYFLSEKEGKSRKILGVCCSYK
jgi:hypothetical protein